MKVGTDGTLLGAGAQLPALGKEGCLQSEGETSCCAHVLDVGTGTGLVALMMAQRYPEASIVGIDIDEEAVVQATENAAGSPFSQRVVIRQADFRTFVSDRKFDAIVSNPPFFDQSLTCPDDRRTTARHTSSLRYADLMASARRLLSDGGELSLIIPSECLAKIEAEAAIAGFFKVRQCAVKTTPRKQPRRYLLAFRRHPSACLELSEVVLEDQPGVRSAWYAELTKAFYL